MCIEWPYQNVLKQFAGPFFPTYDSFKRFWILFMPIRFMSPFTKNYFSETFYQNLPLLFWNAIVYPSSLRHQRHFCKCVTLASIGSVYLLSRILVPALLSLHLYSCCLYNYYDDMSLNMMMMKITIMMLVYRRMKNMEDL